MRGALARLRASAFYLKHEAVITGVVAGASYGVLARVFLSLGEMGSGVMLLMTVGFIFFVPFTIGYLTVRPAENPTRLYRFFAPWIACAAAIVASILFGFEGSICAVFGSPVMLLMSSLGGSVSGTTAGRSKFFPYAVLLAPWGMMSLEAGRPLPDRLVATETAIEIEAPISAVWPLVVSVDTIRATERHSALFTAIGFPAPIAATLDRPGVGGIRTASFERGVVFHELVTAWEPERRIKFTIDASTVPTTALDPHVTIGGPFFDVLNGTYELRAMSATRTALTLRSEHRVSTRFNSYAEWWAQRVMASIQRNILEVLKGRAERRGSSVSRAAGRSAR